MISVPTSIHKPPDNLLSLVHMQGGKRGFTIVELLIVIVVIAILAAIVTVAFNGIRDRARVNSITSDLVQVDRKLRVYYVEHNEKYPVSLADAGVTNSGSVTYTYTYDAEDNSYCAAAVSNGLSYNVTNTNKPAAGQCVVASTAIVPGGGTSPASEEVSMAFDGNLGSKWLVFGTSMNVIFSTTAKIAPTSYVITSGNDYDTRDPLNWTFEGSTDRVSWTVLDTRVNQTFSGRNQSRTFSITGSGAYRHFKYDVSQNSGAAETQLSEIQIPGATVQQ